MLLRPCLLIGNPLAQLQSLLKSFLLNKNFGQVEMINFHLKKDELSIPNGYISIS